MITFAVDYYLFTFVAAIGVIQIAGSVGRLQGLLVFKSPIAAQTFGLTLAIAALIWFFTTDSRNINDRDGGLDANDQALFFSMGAASAMAATAVLSSLFNVRMTGGNRAPAAGLDALRYTNYVRAVGRSLRYWLTERARPTAMGRAMRDRTGRLTLALSLVALLLSSIILTWQIGWSDRSTASVAAGDSVILEKFARVDDEVFLWINGWVGAFPAFDRVTDWVVSDYMVPAGLALTLIGLWFVGENGAVRLKNQIGVMVALSAMGLASWSVYLLNGVFFRDRPFIDHNVSMLFYRPDDSSFPANSAAATFAIAAAVWGINKRVGTVLFVVAAVYGLTRVYAGVHYPLDIVAAAVIGVVVTMLVFRLKDLLEPLPSMVIRAARILCLA